MGCNMQLREHTGKGAGGETTGVIVDVRTAVGRLDAKLWKMPTYCQTVSAGSKVPDGRWLY